MVVQKIIKAVYSALHVSITVYSPTSTRRDPNVKELTIGSLKSVGEASERRASLPQSCKSGQTGDSKNPLLNNSGLPRSHFKNRRQRSGLLTKKLLDSDVFCNVSLVNCQLVLKICQKIPTQSKNNNSHYFVSCTCTHTFYVQ